MGYDIFVRVGVCARDKEGKGSTPSREILYKLPHFISTDDFIKDNFLSILNRCKWYSMREDILHLTTKFSTLRFVFTKMGEDEDDNKYFFAEGDELTAIAEIPLSKQLKEDKVITYVNESDQYLAIDNARCNMMDNFIHSIGMIDISQMFNIEDEMLEDISLKNNAIIVKYKSNRSIKDTLFIYRLIYQCVNGVMDIINLIAEYDS